MARNSVATFDDFLEEYIKHEDAIRACFEIGVYDFKREVKHYIRLTPGQIKLLKYRALYDYLIPLSLLKYKMKVVDRVLNDTKCDSEEVKEHLVTIIRKYELNPNDAARKDSLTANALLQQFIKNNGGDQKDVPCFKSYKDKSRKRKGENK